VPPGFKDQGKPGDLIIWNTILHLGVEKKKSIIFVSTDEKTDWWHQSNLVALFGADQTAVTEIRRAEELSKADQTEEGEEQSPYSRFNFAETSDSELNHIATYLANAIRGILRRTVEHFKGDAIFSKYKTEESTEVVLSDPEVRKFIQDRSVSLYRRRYMNDAIACRLELSKRIRKQELSKKNNDLWSRNRIVHHYMVNIDVPKLAMIADDLEYMASLLEREYQ
jgi:hypothetical protein